MPRPGWVGGPWPASLWIPFGLPTCNIEISTGGAGGKSAQFIQTQVVISYPFSLTWTPPNKGSGPQGRKVTGWTSDGRDTADPLFSLRSVVPRRNF